MDKKSLVKNQQFLQAIISAVKLISTAMPMHMLGIKDINSVNVYCSKCFADAIGVAEESIIGHTFCPNPILEIVVNEDRQVFQSRRLHSFLKINKFHNMIKPLIFIKLPLINPDTDDVVGLLFQVFEYGIANDFNQQIGSLYNMFSATSKKLSQIKLSRREKQVVFFFMAHLSSQEIADMLYQLDNKRVSKSTIDSIFTDQLYLKFNVTNRIALHQKLLKLGYDRFIPQEVLVTGSMPLEAAKIY
jgi:hypothetical protein